MIIQGEKISLEPYTFDRCHEVFEQYIPDPATTEDDFHYDRDIINRYYQVKVLRSDRVYFGICAAGKCIGEIQLKQIDKAKKCGTLSILIANDSYKGMGCGSEAQRLLLDYAKHALDLRTIYADAVLRSERSRHILTILGFEHLSDDEQKAYYRYLVT